MVSGEKRPWLGAFFSSLKVQPLLSFSCVKFALFRGFAASLKGISVVDSRFSPICEMVFVEASFSFFSLSGSESRSSSFFASVFASVLLDSIVSLGVESVEGVGITASSLEAEGFASNFSSLRSELGSSPISIPRFSEGAFKVSSVFPVELRDELKFLIYIIILSSPLIRSLDVYSALSTICP